MTHELRHDMEFAPVQKLRFGADIQASDGQAGTLVSVIVADKQPWTITHIGLRVNLLPRHMYFVPFDLVTAATASTVTLSIPLATIEQLTSPLSALVLTRATHVGTADGPGAADKRLGRLAQVTIDQKTQALHRVVVDRGRHGKVLAPACVITGITARAICVRVDGAASEHLTQYRSDDELRRDAYDKLFDAPPLRIDLPGIVITPIDGAVWLNGHVSSQFKRCLGEDQLRGLAGMTALHNELVSDDELAAAVSMVLAHDRSIIGQHIGVYPRLGEVRLRGSVQTSASRERAGGVAEAVPYVKGVVNELRIDPTADEIPDLAEVTNNADLIPGGR
jgi:osmotically-inducible protein OsmY